MSKKRNNRPATLPPLTPDFSKPVPTMKDREIELLNEQVRHQQRVIDNLRANCGEYRKIIKLLQFCNVLKPSPVKA